jgi:hypothetical protein
MQKQILFWKGNISVEEWTDNNITDTVTVISDLYVVLPISVDGKAMFLKDKNTGKPGDIFVLPKTFENNHPTPLDTALALLKTHGITANKIGFLMTLQSPFPSTHGAIHIFVATGCKTNNKDVAAFTLQSSDGLVKSGELLDPVSIAAIYHVKSHFYSIIN